VLVVLLVLVVAGVLRVIRVAGVMLVAGKMILNGRDYRPGAVMVMMVATVMRVRVVIVMSVDGMGDTKELGLLVRFAEVGRG